MGGRHRRSSLSSSSSSCSSVKSSVLLRKIGSRNCEMDTRSSGGSIRIHHLTVSTKEGVSRFPKLEECAHFHYEHVELGPLQVSLYEEDDLKSLSSLESNENSENKWLVVKVSSQGQKWLLRRTYENFRMLDQQLHQCIYDRKFSALPELPPLENLPEKQDPHAYIKRQLNRYCERFSCIAGSLINCGPVLSWFQLDNRGRRILVTDDDNCPINTPAVAAAYAIKKYIAVASDEISFDIGDMISVIDMPPPEDSIWWRGKRGFLVGFFPSQCVAVITDKVPRNLHLNQPNTVIEPTKPVLRKHGKLIAFFRAFILSRPSRRHLKQSGILKERVFGCDLGEHLLNTGRDIPMVLKCCAEFIEQHGIVDGIYRLSGVTSNIQKLRTTFDEDRLPVLYNDENILQDIHSVASLLKMYFRELPNPLCTYQLYKSFVAAVQHSENSERIILMKDTVQKLPPPHYRTLEYLMKHLARVAEHGNRTGMTARNIAIVWAPNLLRCKELEVGGVAALQGVGVQAVVTEFLITNVNLVFSLSDQLVPSQGTVRRLRPKSISLGTPTKLLSLEEAQIKKSIEPGADSSYIEVGGGPACLPEKYHTVIELPMRKRAPLKRSPLGWKSLFTRNMYNTVSGTRKSTSSIETKRKTSVPDEISVEKQDVDALMDSELKNKLRTVKSAESLSNNSNVPSLRNSIIANEYFSPPSPKLPSSGHSRSVSHDSYFDQLAENSPIHVTLQPPDEEGLSDLRVNFDLDESEMKIFSEDDSGQVFSNESSLDQFQLTSKHEAKLASSENTITADPSPKKHKTSDNGSCNSISFSDDVTAISNKRSRLEERLSSGVDFAFIDSHGFGPEQIVVEVDVHRDANNTDTSFLSSSVTDITYSDTLSGYTMSDTVGINGGYTPLSEESCSVQTRSSSRATDDYPKHSSHIMIAGNRYENLPRNRHSYQGSGELLHQHFSNCPRNRLSLQGITKDSSANEYAAIIIDGDRGSGVVGSKSFSDACLTIHVNGGLSSSTENAYEYVCGNSNDDDNVFKDEQSYSAVSSTPTYYNGTTSTIALSCNSQDKFAFGTELENKYEYVSTVPFNYARHSVNIDTATSNTAASATVNTSNGSSSCDGTESHFVYRLSDSVKNGKSAGDVDAIIATNSLESPYELVSVADNKIVITPRYNFSTNLNSTAEEENAGETFSKLIEIPDIDSNYEDLSIGKAEFLSSPDNSESSTDEAMIENHLYESLVTEESSPEASDEQKSFSRPHHVTEYEKKYQDNDDKENCYEKFVINEYYEGENCVLLNDHQPLLLFSEKPSPFSDDVSSSYSPYENQMRALNKECDSKESGNGNSYNHVYVNSEIKGDADGSQFGKRSSMLHVSNRNCERRQSNYSKNEDKEEDANASEKSLSPMHYALQKLEEQNSSPQRNLLSSTSPQSNHSDNADCNKNVQQLMSKFEWSFAGIQCSPEEEKGKVAKGKPNDSPKTPYTKRNSDSRLYRNSDRYSGNEKSLTQTTSLETVKCTSPSSAASTFSRRLSGATSEPSAIRLLVNEDEKNGQTADAVVRRERIEKYKEERRLLLRQKYKTDNIKDVNDEKEEEMIKRFKQKILRAPSTATSDEDVASAAKCSKQKVARPNHLSLNSNVNHTPQYKPSSPSNVTTINILYSPTRSNHQLKSQDKTGNDEDSPASDQCLSLLSDSASSTAVALDKVTCISARYLRSFSQPTAEHGNDRATDNTYRGSSGGSLTIPPAASKKTYGRSAQSSSSLASCYTASLERRKHAKEKSTDGFVAQRISQLSAANLQTCPDEKSFSPQLQQQQQQQQQLVLTATSSNVDVKQNNSSLATTGIRQRAHSTSGPVVQYCIRDIAAIFENKDNK